jgi:hypothetical protein
VVPQIGCGFKPTSDKGFRAFDIDTKCSYECGKADLNFLSKLSELRDGNQFAPNGGVRPVPGPSNGLLLQIVGVPPLGPVFQMMPLNESDT